MHAKNRCFLDLSSFRSCFNVIKNKFQPFVALLMARDVDPPSSAGLFERAFASVSSFAFRGPLPW